MDGHLEGRGSERGSGQALIFRGGTDMSLPPPRASASASLFTKARSRSVLVVTIC